MDLYLTKWHSKRFFLQVGLLDIDLCGPSVPYLLGLEKEDIYQCEEGWVPIYTDDKQDLAVMSIGFLLKNKNDPIIWRGPKKTVMIKQFLSDVKWDELDYLIIDTPPGKKAFFLLKAIHNLACLLRYFR